MSLFTQELRHTAGLLLVPGKGILGMDDSNSTCNKRLMKFNIPATEEQQHTYRELILTTPSLGKYISGIVMHDDAIRQSTQKGVAFVKAVTDAGVILGIKVDKGAKDLAGYPHEKVTEGLDGLRDRIAEYYQLGVRFAKWRAMIPVGNSIPSRACIEANAHALARYAALCQEGGLVPLVEPEVLRDGDHSIELCYEVTDQILHAVFNQLHLYKVEFDQMILKPSKVISGLSCPQQASVEQVSEMTIKCLLKNVPATVAGIILLSGGQNNEHSTKYLNAMNTNFSGQCPWPVTFYHARAIQQTALEHWRGDRANLAAAQKMLYHQIELSTMELPVWANTSKLLST